MSARGGATAADVLSIAGAAAYGLWGVIHAYVGGHALWAMATGDVAGALSILAGAAPASAADGLPGAVEALLANHAFNILCLGLVALAVAATLNARSSIAGYWINLILIDLTDAGVLVLMVAHGHVPLIDGLIGPGLWAIGAMTTTAGVLLKHRVPLAFRVS